MVKRFKPPFPRRIRTKLIIAYLVPAVLLTSLMGGYFYFQARLGFEEEMGRRLMSVAASAANQIDGATVIGFRAGDENSWAYGRVKERLKRLEELSEVGRIYIFDQNQLSLIDTKDSVPIGTRYFRLVVDQKEIQRAFKGKTSTSTMFNGPDGTLYKTGYAPIKVGDSVAAVLGVDAGVTFFHTLAKVRSNLILIGFAGMLIVVAISIIIAGGFERPIGKLMESAKKIAQGDFQHETPSTSKDEIGFLAQTLNEMRISILERDRYLQTLQRGIAHEVRNPLGGIELYADLLVEELSNDPPKQEYALKIRKELLALNKVVNEFLDFTRESVPDKRSVKVKDFLLEVLEMSAPQAVQQKIKTNYTVSNEATDAVFDPDQVRRALFNLIFNSYAAMPNGGKLSLKSFVENDELIIEVEDTGKGITSEDMNHIFTPFYTTKDKGTGLGLPFARKIARAHGGDLTLNSSVGYGTVARLSLPITEK